MPPPQYLSKKKKTERLSFTITPYLKKELNDFIEEQKQKNEQNPEYKSISSFCYHAIQDVLDIRKKGLSLNSIKSQPDTNTQNFYDQITFKAVTQNFEIGIAPNRYNDDNIIIPYFLFTFRKYVLATMDPASSKSIQLIVDKMKNFLVSNKLTKELRLDLFRPLKNKYHSGVIEFIGNYTNLHYENCKALAALLGVLGIKIKEFTFSESDIYARFDIEETELLYRRESLRKKRQALLEENLQYLINYEKIINDKSEYLWSKLSKSKHISLNFMTSVAFDKWFNKFLGDFKKYSDQNKFLLNILKTFEKMHWLSIEDEDELSFRLKVINEKSQMLFDLENLVDKKYNNDQELKKIVNLLLLNKSKEEILLFKYIEPYASIRQENDVYYLEKKN
ncbi:MAG: hypothetical protein ACFFAS_12955 [Promethearchaeota archaeon]